MDSCPQRFPGGLLHGLGRASASTQKIWGMQRRVPTLSGSCRGNRKGFPEKGRQDPNLEAEQAGAKQAGEGGRRCGQRERPLHRPRSSRGPEALGALQRGRWRRSTAF